MSRVGLRISVHDGWFAAVTTADGRRARLTVREAPRVDEAELEQKLAAIDRLSPRQVEVLRGVGLGEPVATLANRLGVSRDTAKTHLAAAYGALGLDRDRSPSRQVAYLLGRYDERRREQ